MRMPRPAVRMALRRLLVGGGRWTGPGRNSVVMLALVAGGLVIGGGAGLVWAHRSAPPGRTLALAAGVLPEPPGLDSALEVAWAWSVEGAANLEDRGHTLLAPGLPPGICLPAAPTSVPAPDARSPSRDPVGSGGAGPPGADGRAELVAALRRLNEAVVRGAQPGEMESRLGALRAAGAVDPGARTAFVVRYNLARGLAAAGDEPAAAEVLEPVLSGWIGLDRVPETDRRRAPTGVADGRMDERLALDAIHGRYLAATLAFRRGEAANAVTLFRRTINAFHHLLAARARGSLASDAHERRTAADLGASGCPGARADGALTSLDAYAGLVASYMAHGDFRDPGRLRAEVRRDRLQIDPGDPFGPVLEHARRTGGDPRRTPIPENLLWAASNLQRVYHANRLRPEPRLEVARAILLLRLTADEARAEALRDAGAADVCAMLAGLASDMARDAGALGASPRPTAVDSVRAAVAIRTFGRLRSECGEGVAVSVDPHVRSAWIRLADGWLTRGLGGRYEEMRIRIRTALADAAAPPAVLEEQLASTVDRIRSDRRAFGGGRVPADLPADLPVEPARRFVEAWERALWTDVADGLAARVRRSGDGEVPVRAGQVRDLLTALESAAAHAGRRPSEAYRAGETAALAVTGGTRAGLTWRLRTWVRDRPAPAASVVLGATLFLLLVAVSVHVSAWRLRLLVGRRFYRDEAVRAGDPGGRAP